jgi:hypothetical protein
VLNFEFRYQLTPIGAPAPGLYVASEVKGNQFQIAGQKISWQVTGIRQDPYANENRIQVEEMKTAADQGRFLYPKGYGATEESGIGYVKEEEPGGN